MIEKEILDDINRSIKQFEKDLKVPNGFFTKLLNEDDWSFVIKISALLETASTDALTKVLGYKEIEEVLTYLDYGNAKSGKIVLMEKLDIVYKNQASVLRKLLELRNKIAHRLENINFTFDEHIKGFDSGQKKSFIDIFGRNMPDIIKLKSQKIEKRDFILENPKITIWLITREIISCMYLSKEKKEIENKLTIKITPDNKEN